jgi:hypothetical protein
MQSVVTTNAVEATFRNIADHAHMKALCKFRQTAFTLLMGFQKLPTQII